MCTESFEEAGDLCPHVLSCGHSFCCKDLKRLVLSMPDTLCCPTCLKKSQLCQYDEGFPPKNHSMLEALRIQYQAEMVDDPGLNARHATGPEEGIRLINKFHP